MRGRLGWTLAPVALALFATISLVAQAGAQAGEQVKFDPSRDLEGFEECYASEFSDLYALEDYSRMLGKEMTSADLYDVRERWRKDLAEGEAKLATLRADPREECLWLLRRRLSKSTFFSKIAFAEDRSVPGFVFFLQKPPKDIPDRADGFARGLGPWLEKLQSAFEEHYAKPLELTRSRQQALWSVAVLSSESDYRNFWRVHPNPSSTAPFASYDPFLRLVVGHVEPRASGAQVELRYPFLHAFVFEMLCAYSTSPLGRPSAVWLEEGLATYLAWHEGDAPERVGEPLIRPATIEKFAHLAKDKAMGPLVLHPLEELVALESREDVDHLVTRRAEAAGRPRPSQRDVEDGFLAESALWVHFFHRARGGALRKPFLEYLRLALSVEGGPSALRRALAQPDLAVLDREFLRWILAQHAHVFPQAKLDPGAFDSLFPGSASR